MATSKFVPIGLLVIILVGTTIGLFITWSPPEAPENFTSPRCDFAPCAPDNSPDPDRLMQSDETDGMVPDRSSDVVMEIEALSPDLPDDAEEQLRVAVDNWILAFEARDPAQLQGFYVNHKDTYAEWLGQAGAFQGSYKGYSNIRLLLATILGRTSALDMNINEITIELSGDKGIVDLEMWNTGEGDLIGHFNMSVQTRTIWQYQDSGWQIIDDRWNFLMFETEVVAEGTVFALKWRQIGDYTLLNREIIELLEGLRR